MIIRRYREGEELELWQLLHDTVHIINVLDYTPAQCELWAPGRRDMKAWSERIRTHNPFVAVEDEKILGFAELEPDGHIDCFYCHHEYQRKGVGTALYQAIIAEARRLHLSSLHAAVSITAIPFFLHLGFQIVKEQHNVICGDVLTNFIMEYQFPGN